MTGGTAYPLQEQPAYAPVANQVYGTGQDPFNLTLGGYYVSPASLPQYPGEPTHYNAYGEHHASVSSVRVTGLSTMRHGPQEEPSSTGGCTLSTGMA